MSTVYVAKRILGHKIEHGKTLYHTEWKGCPIDQATWEPSTSFCCSDMLSRYWFAVAIADENEKDQIKKIKADAAAAKVAIKAAKAAAAKEAKAIEKAAKEAAKEAAKAAEKAAKAEEKAAAKEAKIQAAAAAATELAARRAAVVAMNDHQLIAEFIRLFNKKELPCTHCNGETHITNWVHSIRKRAMRNGLTASMKIPKTCDEQQARNMISNPVNNPVYARLRPIYDAAPYNGICPVCVVECVQQRKDGLAAVGITAKPYKYVSLSA